MWVPEAPRLIPKAPTLIPESPRLIPEAPRVIPESPRLIPEAPGLRADTLSVSQCKDCSNPSAKVDSNTLKNSDHNLSGWAQFQGSS